MNRALLTSRMAQAALTSVALALVGCGGSSEDEPVRARTAPAPTIAVQALTPSLVRQESAVIPPADDLADIRRQLAALRSEVAQLQRRLNEGGRQAPDAAGIPAGALEPAPPESERLMRIEAQFRSETADAAWSQGAVARVRAAIAEIGDGIAERLRSVECRSKSCRLEIAADASQPIDETLPRIVVELGATFTTTNSVHIDQGDGRQAGVLFLTR